MRPAPGVATRGGPPFPCRAPGRGSFVQGNPCRCRCWCRDAHKCAGRDSAGQFPRWRDRCVRVLPPWLRPRLVLVKSFETLWAKKKHPTLYFYKIFFLNKGKRKKPVFAVRSSCAQQKKRWAKTIGCLRPADGVKLFRQAQHVTPITCWADREADGTRAPNLDGEKIITSYQI